MSRDASPGGGGDLDGFSGWIFTGIGSSFRGVQWKRRNGRAKERRRDGRATSSSSMAMMLRRASLVEVNELADLS